MDPWGSLEPWGPSSEGTLAEPSLEGTVVGDDSLDGNEGCILLFLLELLHGSNCHACGGQKHQDDIAVGVVVVVVGAQELGQQRWG